MSIQSHQRVFLFLVALLALSESAAAQGIVLPGVGPINRSMAGASTAAPIDAAGAMHWNPASMTGLKDSQVVIGAELLYLTTHLGSDVPVAPNVSLSGRTRSDSGVGVLPTVAVAWQPFDSPWTFGLGLFAIGGFGHNFPADDPANPSNLLLQPQPFGAGPLYSRLSLTQIVPSAALKVTDRLSIGMAPTFTIADAALDPAFVASPDANGMYPFATHSRLHWGLGFQLGVYYETDANWRFGASYKSPQWFEDFDSYSVDSLGTPQKITLDLDYPAIYSVGLGYYGIPRTVWALDVRYVDYDNTELFGHSATFDQSGRATGLGWRSIYSVSTGLQYQLTDALSLRGGYQYNQNPIRDEDTFFNASAIAIYEHVASLGATYRISCRTSFSLAYLHAFENSISGPIPTTNPEAPPATVTAQQSVDALVAGVEIHF